MEKRPERESGEIRTGDYRVGRCIRRCARRGVKCAGSESAAMSAAALAGGRTSGRSVLLFVSGPCKACERVIEMRRRLWGLQLQRAAERAVEKQGVSVVVLRLRDSRCTTRLGGKGKGRGQGGADSVLGWWRRLYPPCTYLCSAPPLR